MLCNQHRRLPVLNKDVRYFFGLVCVELVQKVAILVETQKRLSLLVDTYGLHIMELGSVVLESAHFMTILSKIFSDDSFQAASFF